MFPCKVETPVTDVGPRLTGRLTLKGPCDPQLFTAVTVNVKMPPLGGVPDNTPALERLRNGGSPDDDHVIAASPVAVSVSL